MINDMMKYYLIFIATAMCTVAGCRKDLLIENEGNEENLILDRTSYPDWSDSTHSSEAEPDYSMVFNQSDVLRFDIEISSENWETMQSDLASNLGSNSGPGGGRGGIPTSSDFTPVWVSCSFKFNGLEWYHVGIRYKGNSSLSTAYQSGNNKLSLKLDFDEFEDDYPALKNQRFYGFKQLNLNNNFDDASVMREKVASDLFRDFGLVSAKTTFCVVYVNHGTESQYFGVYTLVEEVDDTVLEDQLGSDSGNLYKPDGDAGTFSAGSYNESEMEKKNNEDLADYSDVRRLYDVLNSTSRTSNPELWKSDLETILNVDVFLKWLAANTVIQNWDTYGVMPHNYFLYNNPQDSLLTWIPWDNNEAFQYGKQGGAVSLSLYEVGNLWPLIRYLMDVDEYKGIYEGYMRQFVDEVFVPEMMIEKYSAYYTLLKDYVYAEEPFYSFLSYDAQFDQAVSELNKHVQSRKDAVEAYLQ